MKRSSENDSSSAFEAFEDAALNILMQEHFDLEDEELAAEVRSLNDDPDFELPQDFSADMHKLIDKTFQAKKRKRSARRIGRVAGRAAIVILTIGVGLFFTVDAFQTAVKNLFIGLADDSIHFGYEDTVDWGDINWRDTYMPTYTPKGVSLESYESHSLFRFIGLHTDDYYIKLWEYIDEYEMFSDAEKDSSYRPTTVSDYPAYLASEAGIIKIIWLDESNHRTLQLSTNYDEATAVKIAEGYIYVK